MSKKSRYKILMQTKLLECFMFSKRKEKKKKKKTVIDVSILKFITDKRTLITNHCHIISNL